MVLSSPGPARRSGGWKDDDGKAEACARWCWCRGRWAASARSHDQVICRIPNINLQLARSRGRIHRTMGRSMPERITEANIEHFKRRLATETDPKKRETITRLLAEERAKLRQIKQRQEQSKQA